MYQGERKAPYVAIYPCRDQNEMQAARTQLQQNGVNIVSETQQNDIGIFELENTSQLHAAERLNNNSGNIVSRIDRNSFENDGHRNFENVAGAFNFGNIPPNVQSNQYKAGNILFWLKYYMIQGRITSVDSSALQAGTPLANKLRFYDITQRGAQRSRRDSQIQEQTQYSPPVYQGGFPEGADLLPPATSAPGIMPAGNIPFMGDANMQIPPPQNQYSQPPVYAAPDFMQQPPSNAFLGQPMQNQFSQPQPNQYQAPPQQNQYQQPQQNQNQAPLQQNQYQQPSSNLSQDPPQQEQTAPPPPSPYSDQPQQTQQQSQPQSLDQSNLVQILHPNPSEDITNRWIEDLIYNKTIVETAGDYTDEAQFSITIDPAQSGPLANLAQYSRNNLYTDSNLVLGQDAALALDTIVSRFVIYQIQRAEVVEGLYLVILQGVATLKDNSDVNFTRTLNIVQTEPYYFRIMSDQIHFMEITVEVVA